MPHRLHRRQIRGRGRRRGVVFLGVAAAARATAAITAAGGRGGGGG